MIKKLKKLKVTTKLILINLAMYIIFGVLVYPLIPYLLNYPPNSIDNEFQTTVVGMQYTEQFIMLFILGVVLLSAILYFSFRKLNHIEEYKQGKSEQDKKNLLKVRDIAANGIYRLIPTTVLCIAIGVGLILTLASTEFMLTVKLTVILCIWGALSNLLLYVFTAKIFHKILNDSYYYIDPDQDSIKRLGLKNKMRIQNLSAVLIILFILTFFGYSRIQYERGEFLKEKELRELNNIILEEKDLDHLIETSQDSYFIMTKDGEVLNENCEVSKFAIEYILHFPEMNRVYTQYASSIEGVYQLVDYHGQECYFVKIYNIMPNFYTLYFVIFDAVLLLIYYIITGVFIRNINNELAIVTDRMNVIGDRTDEIGTKIAITSNDEFSDLVRAYNKVQKNTENYVKEINEKQDIIVKQGQLVSIGELAGGVAHDINTPISAIKTGITMLNQADNLTPEQKVILERMDSCSTKIINIVNSMRNQIRNLGSDHVVDFKISDVINDVKVITYHEVTKSKAELRIKIEDDLVIQGDPTKLGQVLTNMVVNAAQAYTKQEGGKIEITVMKAPNHFAMIKVTDFAGGIPEEVRPYIFKNILTTKGTSGTGLGLYLAYSVIKGNFHGDITYETKTGVGTTFYITIPRA